MGSSNCWTVVLGVSVLAGCAAHAQGGVRERSDEMYFQASDAARPSTPAPETSGPFAWSRVDSRFHINVDELSADTGEWTRAGGRPADAAPVLLRLADALDSMPRLAGDRSDGIADAIRRISTSLEHEPMDAVDQRRKVREALLLAARQMTADARGVYAADSNVSRSVADLRRTALAISESGPDADLVRGLVAAHDAIHSFEIALARGRVTMSTD